MILHGALVISNICPSIEPGTAIRARDLLHEEAPDEATGETADGATEPHRREVLLHGSHLPNQGSDLCMGFLELLKIGYGTYSASRTGSYDDDLMFLLVLVRRICSGCLEG